MSQAVSMRPDLYAAYLHGASQWDGEFVSVAEGHVAVYIFMAENDEYYGSQKARDAYDGLYGAYRALGWNDDRLLKSYSWRYRTTSTLTDVAFINTTVEEMSC